MSLREVEDITLSAHQLELLHQLVHGCSADQILDLVIAMLTIAHDKRERQYEREQEQTSRGNIRTFTRTSDASPQSSC